MEEDSSKERQKNENLLHLLKVLWIFTQIEEGWTVSKKGTKTYEFSKEIDNTITTTRQKYYYKEKE